MVSRQGRSAVLERGEEGCRTLGTESVAIRLYVWAWTRSNRTSIVWSWLAVMVGPAWYVSRRSCRSLASAAASARLARTYEVTSDRTTCSTLTSDGDIGARYLL